MTSTALAGLLAGVEEVRSLRTHYPVPRGGIATGVEAVAAKAHGRACVVLLCSHYERYIYAVNEEACEWLNSLQCQLDAFPTSFLLQHTKIPIEELAARDWLNREAALRDFITKHGPIWTGPGVSGQLDHEQMLVWMKAPKPKSLKRFYALYGIDDIFKAVTRNPSTRGDLFFRLGDLVDKRNNIAHGDAQTEALPVDVTAYLNAVSKFSSSADSVLSRTLKKLTGSAARPW
jgi:hypothetical protein